MPKTTDDTLKEARRIAREAGLFFTDHNGEFKLYRKTQARAVYIGKRSSADGLFSFVKRCATAK